LKPACSPAPVRVAGGQLLNPMRIPNEKGQLGKYDAQAERILVDTCASAVALIVVGGRHGHGFSISTTHPKLTAMLPDLLEAMAADLREQNKAAAHS
jgi:hypothetical protein